MCDSTKHNGLITPVIKCPFGRQTVFISFSNVYFQTETDNDVLGLETGGDVTEMTPLYIQTPRSAMTSSSETNTSSVV